MSSPICKDPFISRVNELSESFNNGLIEHDMSRNAAESHNSHEQPESQPEIHTSRTSDFYKSHDWENMIMRNLEQIPHIPQPSVPHRTQEIGHNTERHPSVTNSRRNHCSHCGQPGHRKSLALPALTYYNHAINLNNKHHQ